MSLVLLAVFLGLCVAGVPLAVSLGLGAVATLWYYDLPLVMVAQSMETSINSFLLIAVPLFVLAGGIMERGGLSERIFSAAEAAVGRLKGGLGHVNILSSFVFGGISGSSVADIASIGRIEIQEMTARNYPLPYSAALTLITSTLATLVPPSILVIVAAAAAEQSVGKALAGGLGPGIVLAVALFAYNAFVSRVHGYGSDTRFDMATSLKMIGRAAPSLGAPVIILTAMFSGIVTPTEAAALAVLYTLIVGLLVHREIRLSDLPGLLVEAGRTAGTVLLILMVASTATYVFTIDQLPSKASSMIMAITSDPSFVLLLMALIFLVVGMLMDIVAAALMLIPILLPAAVKAGVDPLHFLIFMVTALAMGLATPPVGTCLFATSLVSGVSVERLSRASMPFYIVNIVVLVVIAFVPQIVLWPANLLAG
ncbi:TRAP transporter large permease [Arenibaculum pallidiluteum]|uniref:TRAP transporter large permease n=1 Tax=Arenibaculum pallidiluteum TaxID=2812559 RepID=UPI001A978755|nr:TRAP transporter large permease [Arenibaculum pallidiluteum]